LTATHLKLPTLEDVKAAQERIRDFVVPTPLIRIAASGNREIYLKPECNQPLGSFKIRAATNAILSIARRDMNEGIYTASAGNFGQGLAHVAASLGIPVDVYVPQSAAKKKLDALRRMGASIHKISFDDWWQMLEKRGHPHANGLFFHPVADGAVIEGNATIGLELLEQPKSFDRVYIPFGGGGLSCGIGSMIKARRAGTRIIACESEAASPLRAAFNAGAPVSVPMVESFINGIGSTSVLEEMWPLIAEMVDDVRVTPIGDVEAAMRLLFDKHDIIAEGAGAVSLAAALADAPADSCSVCIISGGNIDRPIFDAILADQEPV
jgi:threonine dehydratase